MVAASENCPGLPWQLVAAASVESSPDVLTSVDAATGAITGWADPARGVSPYGLSPSDWQQFRTVWPNDPVGAQPDPSNEYDATYTFVRAACAVSANDSSPRQLLGQLGETASWATAVWRTAIAFGMVVSAAAPTSAGNPVGHDSEIPPGHTFAGSAAAFVAAAEVQLGVPYVWGGITAGQGFDCSGLVVVAMRAIGVNLLWSYRTSQEQATLGVPEQVDDIEAGDLLVMAGDDGGTSVPLGHIAIAINNSEMIEAPYTGAVVRIVAIPTDRLEAVRRVLQSP